MRIIALSLALCLLSLSALQAAQPQRKRIKPEGLYNHPAYIHLITVEGNWKTLYVAGQISVDENFDCVGPGDWRAQYMQVMENLKLALAAGGATFSDITYIRRFVTDMGAYFAMLKDKENPVPDYLQGQPPPSTLIEVSALAGECYLMEFDAIAAVPAE